jgi:hypothetical protein
MILVGIGSILRFLLNDPSKLSDRPGQSLLDSAFRSSSAAQPTRTVATDTKRN